ncbi:unnamed protein product [Rhodiola kirilowii]
MLLKCRTFVVRERQVWLIAVAVWLMTSKYWSGVCSDPLDVKSSNYLRFKASGHLVSILRCHTFGFRRELTS